MKYVLILITLFLSAHSIAQEAKKDSTTSQEEKKVNVTGNGDGISPWKLGFGLGVEQYRTPYIDSATLQGPNRLVVVEQEYRTRPSAWLTMNWNYVPSKKKSMSTTTGSQSIDSDSSDVDKTKYGFFAGVKIIDGNANSFSSFALGPQVSFETKGGQNISIGLGWVTHGTKRLADDIKEGQALPSHYTSVVYKKSTENSVMMMMSVSF